MPQETMARDDINKLCGTTEAAQGVLMILCLHYTHFRGREVGYLFQTSSPTIKTHQILITPREHLTVLYYSKKKIIHTDHSWGDVHHQNMPDCGARISNT